MKLPHFPNSHLTYCTNIHPGETWQEVWTQFQAHLPAVKKAVSPNQDFGVGARFSAKAAAELLQDNNLSTLKDWLNESGFYIFTINGFPYGTFHQQRVKEQVYLPDWSDSARLQYSQQLAKILAELLPDNCTGSISTVPIGLKSNFLKEEQLVKARDNLLSMAAFLKKLHQESGRHIQLALEPEPGCYLEKSEDIISFFEGYLLTDQALDQLNTRYEDTFFQDPDIILSYLGICLDTCHTSVMYETPKGVAQLLNAKGIGIFKTQLTSALVLKTIDSEGIAILQQLSDPVYLHQTSTVDSMGNRQFFLDLPDALSHIHSFQEIRTHYHIPVFADTMTTIETSQKDLIDFLGYYNSNPTCPHLEVETYTFDVLPAMYKHCSVVENISQELKWVLTTLDTFSK